MPSPFIYLDHAAATPVDPAVLAAMLPFLKEDFYNPSATYGPARQVRAELDTARAQVAHWLGAKSSEVAFTAGGTEANNLAVQGIMDRYPEANVVVSAIEHESVLAPAGKYECRQVRVDNQGRLDLSDLKSKIDKNTVLVSVGYANNEIGTVQPIREIARVMAEERSGRKGSGAKPIYFHTDACQAGNYLDLHVARLGVDLMTLNGGKIYGPKQSGALYVKAGVEPYPVILGGGQERGLRSGTENVAAAVGFAAALDQSQAMRREESDRLNGFRQRFIDGIGRTAPKAVLNGSQKYRLPNNVHLTLPGQDNERLLIRLEEAGILAAAGSACSASNEDPSHVLGAIGLSDEEARASLRFTMGRATTADMVDRVVEAVGRLL
ncbi:MAG TPA: cysteine desulfurase family protein [Candidatus Saccharimonadales bacterium]|nr:cysteine desulfurase family protein [Candidatus Saccharimonadales bacterium]